MSKFKRAYAPVKAVKISARQKRFWRSLKYDEVYLRAYEAATEAKHFIGRSIEFYNEHRPHSSLGGRTPNEAYLTRSSSFAIR
jgi:transposase InsO family protein